MSPIPEHATGASRPPLRAAAAAAAVGALAAVLAWNPPDLPVPGPLAERLLALAHARRAHWAFGRDVPAPDGPLAEWLSPVLWPGDAVWSGGGAALLALLAALLAAGLWRDTRGPLRWTSLAASAAALTLAPWPWGWLALLAAATIAAALSSPGMSLLCLATLLALPTAALLDARLACCAVGLAALLAAAAFHRTRNPRTSLAVLLVPALLTTALWDALRQPVAGLPAYLAQAWSSTAPGLLGRTGPSAPARAARLPGFLRASAADREAAWQGLLEPARRPLLRAEMENLPVQAPFDDAVFARANACNLVPAGAPAFIRREPPAPALPAPAPAGFVPALAERGVSVFRILILGDFRTPPGQVPAGLDPRHYRSGAGFAEIPLAVSAAGMPRFARANAKPILEFQPPGEVRFRLLPHYCSVRGAFGVPQATDSAVFSVVWESPTGQKRELFRQRLDPSREPADAGVHEFETDIGGLGDGFLVLLCEPAGAAVGSAFWTDVRFNTMAVRPFPSRLTAAEFRDWGSFNVLPLEVRGPAPACAAGLGDRRALSVHAPSEVILFFEPGVRVFSGWFGIADGAWNGSQQGRTDGATFTIRWRSGEQQRTLLRRFVNPAAVAADRGPQDFRIDVGALPGGFLVLSADNGPSANGSYDWTAWGGLTLEGRIETLVPALFTLEDLRRIAGCSTAPSIIRSWTQAAADHISGTPVLLTHAPAELVFPLREPATALRGRCGFTRGAWDPGRTTGAELVITWRSEGRETELHRRTLQPVTRPEDRGLVPFSVDLRGRTGGEVLLRFETGPDGSGAWDWTCVEGLELVPETAAP